MESHLGMESSTAERSVLTMRAKVDLSRKGAAGRSDTAIVACLHTYSIPYLPNSSIIRGGPTYMMVHPSVMVLVANEDHQDVF